MGTTAGGPSYNSYGNVVQGEERWRHFDNQINAVSFGFVATAVLISMFLLMAIFEHFLRSRQQPSINPASTNMDLEAAAHASTKLHPHPSPKMSIYGKGVSVLMPGQQVPTYLAHPAPPPCLPERLWRPTHDPHWNSQVERIGSGTSIGV